MSTAVLLLPLWASVACFRANFTLALPYIILCFYLYCIYILSVLLCCLHVTKEMEASAT